MSEGYFCKACGAPASVDDDGMISRACEHDGTIVASLSAVAHGRGHLNNTDPGIVRFFRELGRRLMRRD